MGFIQFNARHLHRDPTPHYQFSKHHDSSERGDCRGLSSNRKVSEGNLRCAWCDVEARCASSADPEATRGRSMQDARRL